MSNFGMQRKCWWDGVEVDLAEDGQVPQPVKLWARRVWTLELSLVRGDLNYRRKRVTDSCLGLMCFRYP